MEEKQTPDLASLLRELWQIALMDSHYNRLPEAGGIAKRIALLFYYSAWRILILGMHLFVLTYIEQKLVGDRCNMFYGCSPGGT